MTTRKRLISLGLLSVMLFVAFTAFAPQPAEATTGTFGYTSTGTTSYPTSTQTAGSPPLWGGSNTYVYTVPFTASVSGTVTKVGVNVKVAGTYMTGIYSNSGGAPNLLLGVSSSTDIGTDWTDLSLTTAVYVVGGTQYWLGTQFSVAGKYFYYESAGVGNSVLNAYGTFPNPFGAPTTGQGSPNLRITYVQIEGYAKATKATLAGSGVLVSMSFYSHATGNVRLALYTGSSGPNSLLWESASTAASAAAWTTVLVSAGTPASLGLTAGTYWLSWQWDSVNAGPSYTNAASLGNYVQRAYSAYPATWTGGTGSNEEWSIYCTYSDAYTITFALSGIGIDAAGPIITVDGTPYTYGDFPKVFTWNYAATHSVTAMLTVPGSGSNYMWTSWTNGDGLGTYTGTYTVPAANTTVTANYAQQSVMIVSYSISGGGSPTAPTFNYTQGSVAKQFTLLTIPTSISCDAGSTWLVYPNPLTGSGTTERWSTSQTLTGAAAPQAINFVFYHQYKETVSYTVTGGGSPTPPSYTALQYGVSTPETLTGSGTAYWIDSGSAWTVTDPAAGSGSTERWNTLTASGTISSSATTVYPYYHQWLQTLSYAFHYGSSCSAPSLSGSQYGAAYTPTLTGTAAYYWLDNNTAWQADNPLCNSVSERWMSNQTTSGTVHTTQTTVFDYYHQYEQTLSYLIVGGGVPTPPDYSATQFGVPETIVLSDVPATHWLDASAWSVSPNPLTGSSATERWYANQTLTGTLTTTGTTVFIFYHEYTLTVTITPTTPPSGTTIPNGTSWMDAGLNVTLTAYPGLGWYLDSWNGTGTGNYTGTDNPATVTMNGAITELAVMMFRGLNIFVFAILLGIMIVFLLLGVARRGGFILPLFGGILGILDVLAMSANSWIVAYYADGVPVALDFATTDLKYALVAIIVLILVCFVVSMYRRKPV